MAVAAPSLPDLELPVWDAKRDSNLHGHPTLARRIITLQSSDSPRGIILFRIG